MLEKRVAEELIKKSNDDLKKYKFIGAEIKSSRLKMSKTLDAIGNVNKSISYISKIENNKIIPNERCLKELCDELLIHQDDLESMSKFDDCILEALSFIYMLDYDSMQKLYDVYSAFTNIRTNLMRGLYYLMFNKKKELKIVINSLSRIEGSLSIEDYLVYVLICIKELILSKKLVQAYKIIKVVLSSQTAKGDILCIFRQIKFELKTNFHLYCFENEYYEVVKMYVDSCNIKRISEVIQMYNKQRVELLDFDNSPELIEKLHTNNLKFYSHCLTNNLVKATELFDDKFEDEYKLYYYYKMKKIDSIQKMFTTSMSEENMIIANAYKYELEGNLDIYRNYLINICIPYFKEVVNVKKLIYYYEILVNLNSKVSKYKDSVLLGNEVVLLIQEISRIII